LAVALSNDEAGLFGRRLGDVDADAEAHVAVLVRQRSLDEGNVDRNLALADELGYF